MREYKVYQVVILILCISCTSSIYGDYQVTDLGGNNVYGLSLNNNNMAVGYIQPTENTLNRNAFVWTKDTGVQSIGGYIAMSINDNGVIVGQNKINNDYFYGSFWENGILTTLTDRQEIYSINNKGQCTGLISAERSYIPGPYSPFRDDDLHTPGFITLVNPNPTVWVGQGMDLNNKGQVIAGFGRDGVFYNSDGSYIILKDGNYYSTPYSINDSSQIVGGAMTDTGISTLRAVYWATPSSNMAFMGSLGSGYGYADAINNQGVAVGTDSGKAFIWSLTMGMKDLNTLIDPGLGITLTKAVSINDNGNILVWGINSLNENHTYLLVPEPATLLLLGLGAVMLRRKR